MDTVKNSILVDDFEYIASKMSDLNQLANNSFLITGATGLVGSLIVKSLLYMNDTRQLNTKVYAVIRNLKKAETIFRNYLQRSDMEFVVSNLQSEEIVVNDDIDYIIHAAAVTKSTDMVTYPVDTIQLSVFGTNSLLHFAKNKKVKKFIYLSSMEAYGVVDSDNKYDESQLGYLDLSNVRSCYPESKRMCEMLGNSYYHQYGVPFVTARLAQTFGAGISKDENRIFAQFANSVINGKDIVLHTDGASEGNYVYTADAIWALLLLLVKGESGEIYNVANESNHMSIREMAELVRNTVAKGKIKIVYEIADHGYAPSTKLNMSSEKIRSIGWEPQIGIAETYIRMIKWLEE